MSKNKNNFDKRLKNLLTISGVSRAELAHRLGVTVPVVSRWLNGASAPDVYQFREIARYFGMPYEWFLDGGDDSPSTEELAALLGLSEDTVEELMSLAETESDELLGAVDDAVHGVISAVNAVYDDLLSVAESAVEDLK